MMKGGINLFSLVLSPKLHFFRTQVSEALNVRVEQSIREIVPRVSFIAVSWVTVNDQTFLSRIPTIFPSSSPCVTKLVQIFSLSAISISWVTDSRVVKKVLRALKTSFLFTTRSKTYARVKHFVGSLSEKRSSS